jgi:hypothetical protein
MIFKGICIAACAAIVSVAHAADEYDNSKVNAVWGTVTGRAIDTDTEILKVDGNVLTLSNPKKRLDIASYVWVPSVTHHVGTQSVTDTTEWGKTLNYSVGITVTSGAVVTNGRPHPFVFIGYSTRYNTVDANGNPMQGASDLVVPWVATDTIKEADEFVAAVEAAGEGGDTGGGGIECHDPTWIGNNGQECCGYLAALQGRLGACLDSWYTRMWLGCLPSGVVGGFATFKYCISTCAVLPAPANASCAAACVGIGGLVGLDAFIVCMMANEHEYDGCLKRETAQYYTDLANSGCAIRKPTTVHYGANR